VTGETWPWLVLLGLGALHGLNPGMGWLFAVALGLQQGERRAVWRALAPLAAGHALAVLAAVGLALVVGLAVPRETLRWIVVVALLALGVRQLRRHRHPRAGGMRVGLRELVAWSFLVASAHGAGLMAVPFAVEAVAPAVTGGATQPDVAVAHAAHVAPAPASHAVRAHHAPASTAPGWRALLATLLHTAGYLGVSGLLAALVYEFAGLRILRQAWINVDLLWAGSLVLTAAVLAVM